MDIEDALWLPEVEKIWFDKYAVTGEDGVDVWILGLERGSLGEVGLGLDVKKDVKRFVQDG